MGGRVKLKDKIQSIWQNIIKKQPNKKTGYLIIIALIALFLLIVGNIFSPKKKDTTNNHLSIEENASSDPESEEVASQKTDTEAIVKELEQNYQEDLEKMLNEIQGVSEASVMINLDSTNIKVFEKNLIRGQQTTNEADTNGGTRQVEDHTEETQAVLVRQGDQEVPLLIQTKKPEVRGVFVVAKGVDHATVKMWVIEAVSSVLDVPVHKVSVMPKN